MLWLIALYLDDAFNPFLGFCGGDIANYGVNIADASCENNVIVANSFNDYVTAPINDLGTNTYVRGNMGVPDEASGEAVFSGDGVTTTFTIPHGLFRTPAHANVMPASADAAGDSGTRERD